MSPKVQLKTRCFKDFTTNVLRSDLSQNRRLISFFQGWGDGSVVKSTCCSCRRPKFRFQHSPTLGSPHSPPTPAPGNQSTDLFWPPKAPALTCIYPHRNIIKIKIIFKNLPPQQFERSVHARK